MLVQLLTSNSGSYQNLAIFICHLLIGGQFQAVEIFHNPGIVNHHVLQEIHANCPYAIPWLTVDMAQKNIPSIANESYNHIIQIIFPGSSSDFVVKQLKKTDSKYYYYRLIIYL